jgi:hypothetical protein
LNKDWPLSAAWTRELVWAAVVVVVQGAVGAVEAAVADDDVFDEPPLTLVSDW